MPILPPSASLNPLNGSMGVSAIDYSADFDNLFKKIEKIKNIFETGRANGNLVRYIPGLAKPIYQGQIDSTIEKRAYAEDSYRDLRVAIFNIQLAANHYMNFHNVHLVFPMKIQKRTDDEADIDDEEITVNIFFTHWI